MTIGIIMNHLPLSEMKLRTAERLENMTWCDPLVVYVKGILNMDNDIRKELTADAVPDEQLEPAAGGAPIYREISCTFYCYKCKYSYTKKGVSKAQENCPNCGTFLHSDRHYR